MKPELSVLIQICKRLGLTLNEVFSDFSNSNLMGTTDALDLIEEKALLDESSDIQEKLNAIKNDVDRVDLVQFNLIKGVLAFNQYNYDQSYFYFDKVLQETKSDTDNIWTLIAYITKGMILLRQKHIDMANYYFDIVNNSIEKNFNIPNAKQVEILFICKSLGEAYIETDETPKAITIAKRGIDYDIENHRSYFIENLNYICAQAILGIDQNQYDEYKNIAYYDAILQNNVRLKSRIEEFDE